MEYSGVERLGFVTVGGALQKSRVGRTSACERYSLRALGFASRRARSAACCSARAVLQAPPLDGAGLGTHGESDGAVVSVGDLQQFRSVISDAPLVMVKVAAKWCRACKKVERPFARVAEKWDSQLKCAAVDYQESPDIVVELGIRSLPTFVLYKNGQRIDHFSARDADTLEEHVLDNL
eukprot:CAMPEP_0185843962 /NCGR_PEP_ID=MMETSP1354-20130828/307_1 /TAXON_ID=708628 /ORGANISM="Erythrolobus madagascarensis, Strain CCMP3276" /LENGTH=178 /DNA_ID=CAMNT_0028543557 /DNA_START=141 /DNA_END=677 /DNA_ORIENTATION=+